jgi:hypothetical protein
MFLARLAGNANRSNASATGGLILSLRLAPSRTTARATHGSSGAESEMLERERMRQRVSDGTGIFVAMVLGDCTYRSIFSG